MTRDLKDTIGSDNQDDPSFVLLKSDKSAELGWVEVGRAWSDRDGFIILVSSEFVEKLGGVLAFVPGKSVEAAAEGQLLQTLGRGA